MQQKKGGGRMLFNRKGFTLLELMIVIIIVGILATLGVMQYQIAIEKSRGAEARQILGQLRSTCAAVWMEYGNTSYCDDTRLSIGSGDTIVEGRLPGDECWETHFFRYEIGTNNGDAVALRAVRCTSNGKTPDLYSGTASLTLNVDYTGQDNWASANVQY